MNTINVKSAKKTLNLHHLITAVAGELFSSAVNFLCIVYLMTALTAHSVLIFISPLKTQWKPSWRLCLIGIMKTRGDCLGIWLTFYLN